jgi:hypothetical protein
LSQPVKVHLDAMTRYATAMDDLSTDFANTRRQLVDADVTEDSFGMLPESRDVAEVYQQRTTDGLETLNAGTDVFSDMAVAFRQMRDNYQASDQDSAKRLSGANPGGGQ